MLLGVTKRLNVARHSLAIRISTPSVRKRNRLLLPQLGVCWSPSKVCRGKTPKVAKRVIVWIGSPRGLLDAVQTLSEWIMFSPNMLPYRFVSAWQEQRFKQFDKFMSLRRQKKKTLSSGEDWAVSTSLKPHRASSAVPPDIFTLQNTSTNLQMQRMSSFMCTCSEIQSSHLQ